MRNWIGVGFLIFAGVLGHHVGKELSSDALSMLVGIAFGIVAVLPVTILVAVLMRPRPSPTEQGDSRSLAPYRRHPYSGQRSSYSGYPPVIVVSPSNGSDSGFSTAGPHSYPRDHSFFGPPPQLESDTRGLHVVGGSDEDTVDAENWRTF